MGRLLSSLGIGAATIETRQSATPLATGEAVEATVEAPGIEPRGSPVPESDWLEDRPYVRALRFVPSEDVYRGDVAALTVAPLSIDEGLRAVGGIDEREGAGAEHDVAFDQQEVVRTVETADAAVVRRRRRATRHTDVSR